MSGVPERVAPGRPVRVCLVGPSTDILGGQAVQLARLLPRLREAPGLEVDFIAINPRLPGPLRALQRVKYVRTLLTESAYLLTLAARLTRYDVVHVFSASYFSFVLAPTPAVIIARAYGKRTILNYRSGEAEDHLRRWPRTAIPLIRRADRVVVPSGYLVDVFGRFGLAAQAIHNVVDLEQFGYRERRPLRPVFLANRNFEPHYNVATVLRAFGRIQASVPEAQLLVAGDGRQRAELERLAGSLGLRHVRFLGRVEPERMGELYAAADVYLNGSEIDNMPNSIIEAFAAGLPVVTTAAGGIPYIVREGETGLLVPLGDDEGMARAALRLLDDGELAAHLASTARAECLARYQWDVVRDEWVRLYHELAGRSVPDAAMANRPPREPAFAAAEPVER